ncbi:MAG: RluA family pseudouridine synthase [Agathobacter sp.]|nr:RluA family pseudouridine synthase [Agathobacter sp.]
MKEFTIQSNEANQRFDKYLKKILPNASTGFLYKMLRKKNITCNKKKATGTEILKVGDVIQLFFSDETFEKFSYNEETKRKEFELLKSYKRNDLKVIYEDNDVLIADKPYNMLSQKAETSDISANEYLLGYLIRSGSLNFETYQTFKPSVCNRLDRNTTGLLLMGKSLKGLQELSEALRERTVQKFYYAVVKGKVEEDAHLKGFLKKDEKTNKVIISEKELPDSNWIETSFHVLKANSNVSLLEIHLITGKTHQIRAHLSSIGHPIIGDMKYGDAKVNKYYYEKYKINHQMLHAKRLVFKNGQTYIANEPKEFSKVFDMGEV